MAAIVSGANQPLPLVGYQPLFQKAMELCQEVKSLGAKLLSTIEKEDNEARRGTSRSTLRRSA